MLDYLKYNHHINCHKTELKMFLNPLNQLSFCNILIYIYWSAQVQVSPC